MVTEKLIDQDNDLVKLNKSLCVFTAVSLQCIFLTLKLTARHFKFFSNRGPYPPPPPQQTFFLFHISSSFNYQWMDEVIFSSFFRNCCFSDECYHRLVLPQRVQVPAWLLKTHIHRTCNRKNRVQHTNRSKRKQSAVLHYTTTECPSYSHLLSFITKTLKTQLVCFSWLKETNK